MKTALDVAFERADRITRESLWEQELLRRRTPVRISRAEYESIPAYDITTPTGVYFHKIFRTRRRTAEENERVRRREWPVWPTGDPVIIEYRLGEFGSVLVKHVTDIVYDVEFDDTVPRGVVALRAIGDYGYEYPQFTKRVYSTYAAYASASKEPSK